jgi:hypothetical protein
LRKTGISGPRLPETKDGGDKTKAKGCLRASPPPVEKLVRPHDVEALVGRLTQAPELPLFDADDILDPHHVMNSHTPAQTEPPPHPRQKRRKESPRLSASLNVLNDSLTFYRGKIHAGNADPISVRMLLDSGASDTFVSPRVLGKLDGQIRVRKPKTPLLVTIANGERLETGGYTILLVKIGSWTGRIKAWILPTDYDMILGRDFLQTENPQIDWRTSVMTLTDHNHHTCAIHPTNNSRVVTRGSAHLNLMSAKQTRRLLRKSKSEAYLFTVRPTNRGHESEEPGPPKSDDPGIQQILTKHKDLFRAELPVALPPERNVAHGIDTGAHTPVNINAYGLSAEKLDEQAKQVEDLIKKGLIRESNSAWGFPVVFARKPHGKWRMCVDYRALNNMTAKNGYPLPRIQELLDIVGNARILSKIDLTAGYWQIRMGEGSIEKTAFNTIWGKYEWLAMPFGLCNAPATFQSIVNNTLRPLLGRNVVVYLDDILIFSATLEEHRKHVEEVLTLLKKQQLYASPTKCTFATRELEFCGHIVGNGTIRPLPAKIEAVQAWPRPQTVHDVRQFLGLATYYRRFIHDFSKVCVPLHELLKESDSTLRKQRFRPITWTEACESAFRKVKDLLASAPVLKQPDRDRPYVIETDASEWALGMVLMQEDDDRKLHPVAYDGRKLHGAELNYPVHEKELLAIKEAIRTWDRYIDGDRFETIIITDNASLQYLNTTREYSKRLARWIAEFQQYRLSIRYRKGPENVVADAISRRPDLVGTTRANMSLERPIGDGYLALMTTVHGIPEEEWLTATIQFLQDSTEPEDPALRRAVKKHADRLSFQTTKTFSRAPAEDNRQLIFTHEDGVISPYLDPPFRAELLQKAHHEFGHLGFPGLNGIIRPRGWWPSTRADMEESVRNCPNCQVSQGSRKGLEREAAQHMVTSGIRPFERWGIDLVGPLLATPNGNRWIITAIDYATGWPVARAVPDATEETLAEFLFRDLYTHYGAFNELLSDNGANLLSGAVKHFVSLLRARHRTTTPYHPRTNGKVENFNGLIGRILTKYLMGKPTRLWDEYLTKALFAARVREHAITRKSPYFLVYGIHPRIVADGGEQPDAQEGTDRDEQIQQLADARSKANELLLVHAIRKQKIRDSAVTKTSFKIDDWVLVRNEAKQKFESTWFGPYKVVQAHPLGTYALAEPNGRVLRNLINGARLTDANVGDDPSLWASPAGRSALRRAGQKIGRPEELRKILDEVEPPPPTYADLSTFTREEWQEFRRSGARTEFLGEEVMAERVIAKTRAAARKRQKKTVDKALEQGPPGADEWDSEVNDYESEDFEQDESDGYESAEDAHYEPEQGSSRTSHPFAVVIPPPSREIQELTATRS